MAGRIRSIKPEILEDEKTAALSHLAWRLFVSLWLIADDYGNLRGDPTYIMGQALWAAGETRKTVSQAIDELAAVGLIVRYTVRGQSYANIAGWAKHQKVTHIGKPRVPGPAEADETVQITTETPVEVSGGPHETLSRDLRSPISDLRSECSLPHAIPQSVQAPPSGLATIPDLGSLAVTKSELAVELQERTPASAYNPEDPREIGRLAENTWRRVSDKGIELARELRIPVPLPFPEITPGTYRKGFVELKSRIREEGALAPAACDRVLGNLEKQARETGSVEWLAEKVFGENAWLNARNGIDLSLRGGRSASRASRARDPTVGRGQEHKPNEYAPGDQDL